MEQKQEIAKDRTARGHGSPASGRPGRPAGLTAGVVLLLCCVAASPGTGAEAPGRTAADAVGDWSGVLRTPAGELTLLLTIREEDTGGLAAVLESPDQGSGPIPVTTVTVSDGSLSFTIAPLSASYEASWDEVEKHWRGDWSQGTNVLPLTFERGTAPPKPTVEGLDGTWEGTLRRNEVDLRLVLRVDTGERGTVVLLDSPDLGAFNLPVSGFTRDAEAVSFQVQAASVRFEGTLAGDGEEIRGLWTREGSPTAPVTFVRTRRSSRRAPRSRPQTPDEPSGYRAEEVVFDNPRAPGVRLAGTLTLPEGPGPFPAAVLISGSGPQDRDETMLDHKPFAVLADDLTRRGVAVLRYDDRGFGESTGNHAAATSADFARDANAAARYLRTRPEIDRAAIGFIGHSEGGIVAPMAASDNADIAFVVLLAAPGTRLEQLVLAQRRLLGVLQGQSEEDLTRTEPLVSEMLAAVAQASDPEEARQRVDALLTPEALVALGIPESQRIHAVREYSRDWLRFLLRHDPAATLTRVDVPVLVLNGSLDRLVPAEDHLPAIAAALEGNPDVTVQELDRLNHLFQTAETGSFGEYADLEETFSPRALGIIGDWIRERFGARRAGSRARGLGRHAASRGDTLENMS